MRILCLHGVGSSGAILETQMMALRRELDPSVELVFADGPFECGRGQGVDDSMDGPFFSHTNGYSPVDMAEAIGCLADVLEDEGPFDGVFGFSQGAALTLSYLYQQQIKGVRPLMNWVMLFSSAMPCGADVNIGEKVVARLQELDVDVRDRTMSQKALAGVESEFVRALQRTVVDADDSNSLMPWFDMAVYQGEQSEAAPRVMIPDILKQKIKTPTVHVWGRNDHPFMINMAMVAESICDKSRSKSVMHTGSHQPPQKTMEVRASLRAMEWAIVQAQATAV